MLSPRFVTSIVVLRVSCDTFWRYFWVSFWYISMFSFDHSIWVDGGYPQIAFKLCGWSVIEVVITLWSDPQDTFWST
jgi:hypothetical protein